MVPFADVTAVVVPVADVVDVAVAVAALCCTFCRCGCGSVLVGALDFKHKLHLQKIHIITL